VLSSSDFVWLYQFDLRILPHKDICTGSQVARKPDAGLSHNCLNLHSDNNATHNPNQQLELAVNEFKKSLRLIGSRCILFRFLMQRHPNVDRSYLGKPPPRPKVDAELARAPGGDLDALGLESVLLVFGT
jgi:hypothetical protein